MTCSDSAGGPNQRGRSYLLEEPTRFARESARLSLQAKHLFRIESDSLVRHGLPAASKILELGCGNGFFLSELRNLTNGRLIGVDRNQALLDQARLNLPEASFTCLELGESDALSTLIAAEQPDFFVARYVLQHMSSREREHMLRLVRGTKRDHARILLIDVDDRLTIFDPPSPALTALLRMKGARQALAGGDRTIGSDLARLLLGQGYAQILESAVEFSSSKIGWDNWEAIFWPVIRAGIPDVATADDEKLIDSAKNWFSEAASSEKHFASFTVLHASGV